MRFCRETRYVANTRFLEFFLLRFDSDKCDSAQRWLRYLRKKWRVKPLILMTFVSTFSITFFWCTLMLYSNLIFFKKLKKGQQGPTHGKNIAWVYLNIHLCFFCEDFCFCWKVLSISARRGNISPSAATIVFLLFFQTHTKVVIIKRDFASKQQNGNF